MRLGGPAAYICEVTSRTEITDAVAWAESQKLPMIMIGGGSNSFWRDEGFPGLVIINKIKKFEDFNEDETNHYITIGAGEDWDRVVGRVVEMGLTGIECLSLIPGSAGAAPVQNIGAYGQELSETLVTVEAYDLKNHTFFNLRGPDCQFGYRTSAFKTTERGRYFISAITLHLMKGTKQPPFYGSLQKYLDDNGISDYSPASLRQAVIAIRRAKLPDPAQVANNGSFFANPVIDQGSFVQLSADYPNIPHWETGAGIKLSAAWLLEQAGFKDYHDPETGMATWGAQPLVLVNEKASSTANLLAFKQKLVNGIKQKFDIDLVQEPELLP